MEPIKPIIPGNMYVRPRLTKKPDKKLFQPPPSHKHEWQRFKRPHHGMFFLVRRCTVDNCTAEEVYDLKSEGLES